MDNTAYYQNLDPFSFLERSSLVYPEKPAVAYRERVYSYRDLRQRVDRLAGALRQAGIAKGDRVACIAPNIPPMLEAHYGPMSIGAVLVPINTRLAPPEVAHILNHSRAKALLFDSEFAPLVRQISPQIPSVELYVQIVDEYPRDYRLPGPEYEEFLAGAPPGPHRDPVDSELDTISVNYTSGSTGTPKGVQCHSRGAYLNALGEIIEMGLNWRTTYLWTLPMFHCNGWCFTWAVTAVGGVHICLRRVDPARVYDLIQRHAVTHLCGAPTVLTGMYASPAANNRDLSGVTIATGGAPPAPQIVRAMESMGATIIHLYGLTETFGPITICEPQPSWDAMTPDELAIAKTPQGTPYIHAGVGVAVVDDQLREVPRDGQTMGEVVMRANGVMKGYLDDPETTAAAFSGGWFHSGDLAVWRPNGQIELQDRAKDIIISGGENISSQQIEKVIMEHPAVLEVSVIAIPDDHWGETPKAFIVPRDGATLTEAEIIAFCRERIARFKVPKRVEFGELPKTATGKIQKYILRQREWAGRQKRIH